MKKVWDNQKQLLAGMQIYTEYRYAEEKWRRLKVEPLINENLYEENHTEQRLSDQMILEEGIKYLREKEVTILKSIYVDKKTLKEVANDFGVSRERIRQINAKTEEKIKMRLLDLADQTPYLNWDGGRAKETEKDIIKNVLIDRK